MALPHNEITRKMAEELVKDFLANGGVFENLIPFDLLTPPLRLPRQNVVFSIPMREEACCIPIIPPGQEDDAGQAQSEEPKGGSLGDVREHYFEKRIRRVGGPPRPPKAKPLFTSEPAAADAPNASDEWVHRAIGIAGQRR